MEHKSDRGEAGGDADGVRTTHDARAGLRRRVAVLAATAAVLLAALVVSRVTDRRERGARPAGPGAVVRDTPRVAAPPRAEAPRAEAPRRVRRPQPVTRRRIATADPGAAGVQADAADTGAGDDARPVVDARDYIAALQAAGEREGLAAFPAPGTRPPQSGVVVPDDYALPEGFARHYQNTDDGRQLAPVLVVAPEYDLLDDAGNPVPLAADRIVPPEFAPPDLPVRMLEIPPDPAGEPGAR